jgi:hypothetical protein
MNSSIEWFDAGRGNLDEFAGVVTDQFWNGVRHPTDTAHSPTSSEPDTITQHGIK